MPSELRADHAGHHAARGRTLDRTRECGHVAVGRGPVEVAALRRAAGVLRHLARDVLERLVPVDDARQRALRVGLARQEDVAHVELDLRRGGARVERVVLGAQRLGADRGALQGVEEAGGEQVRRDPAAHRHAGLRVDGFRTTEGQVVVAAPARGRARRRLEAAHRDVEPARALVAARARRKHERDLRVAAAVAAQLLGGGRVVATRGEVERRDPRDDALAGQQGLDGRGRAQQHADALDVLAEGDGGALRDDGAMSQRGRPLAIGRAVAGRTRGRGDEGGEDGEDGDDQQRSGKRRGAHRGLRFSRHDRAPWPPSRRAGARPPACRRPAGGAGRRGRHPSRRSPSRR